MTRGRFLGFMSVAVACVIITSSIAQGKEGGKPPEEVSWTIALYVAGDNDLESYWEGASLQMLLNLASTAEVDFVAYVDLMSTNETTIVEIDGGEWNIAETLPEKNFADDETLQWMLTDVAVRYPADHLAVIAWDHGSAWNGFCGDYTSDDWMYLDELYDAIVGAGVHIDIIGFDACSMASIETVYSVSTTGLVDIVVASEELVAGDGFPYDFMFAPLVEDPDRTPIQVASDMIDGWELYYSNIGWGWYATLSAIDASAINEGVDVIKVWAELMLDRLDVYRYDYRIALRDCTWVSCISHYQADMVDLGRYLLLSPVISEDSEFVDATERMMECVTNAVIDMYNPDRKSDACGLTIYWGYHNWEWRYYWMDYMNNVPFASESSWGEFLYYYNAVTCGWFPIK
ncbi:MAG: hypothetical protein JSV94_04230 [Methanobacteriota archaeon]|nr:MAG: hypothetical protein JSV94_04230 [Euryarchaeota archaeon]